MVKFCVIAHNAGSNPVPPKRKGFKMFAVYQYFFIKHAVAMIFSQAIQIPVCEIENQLFIFSKLDGLKIVVGDNLEKRLRENCVCFKNPCFDEPSILGAMRKNYE